MWQDLMDVLSKICVVYDNLAKIEERKRDALVGIDMEGLSKILDEENLAASKIQKLEKKRGAILQELAKNRVEINDSTKAEDFYKYAPSLAVEKRLLALHKNLSKSVERAIKIRDNNQILAQSALDAVKYHLNRLSGAAVEQTYGAGGNIVTHQKKFDFNA